jgi:hypothetical protein
VQDKQAGGGGARGRGEARADEPGEGAAPGRDVGLVAVGVEGALGLEVGVEGGEAGSGGGCEYSGEKVG